MVQRNVPSSSRAQPAPSKRPQPRRNKNSRKPKTGWLTILGIGILAYLVAVLFFPILGYQFTDYDISKQLLARPQLQGLSLENLKYILTTPCITSYYPVRSLSYALDYELWGLHPGGFKLTNGLIHLANVLLVFYLILRLFRSWTFPEDTGVSGRDICMAVLCAGLFAIHPIVVQPVAWVPGREELLMTLGTLGCIHWYLTARHLGFRGEKRRELLCDVAATVCCALACLSNAVGAVVPLLAVVLHVLIVPRPSLKNVLIRTCAFWLIGAATIAIKRLGAERSLEQAAGAVGAFSPERLLLVLNVYWTNLKLLFWPRALAIEYPAINPRSLWAPGVVFGSTAVVVTCILIWRGRHNRGSLFGLTWFVLALGPTMQIMPHHIDHADRFLYLPLVGLVLAAGFALRHLTRKLTPNTLTLTVMVVALGMIPLYLASVAQVRTWQNSLTMWENCLAVNPNSGTAHGGLADNLVKQGEYSEAAEHYRLSLQQNPEDPHSLKRYALLLATCPEQEVIDHDLAISLARRACDLQKDLDPGPQMILAEVCAQAGQVSMAVTATETAIHLADLQENAELADQLRQRLQEFLAQSPDSPAHQTGNRLSPTLDGDSSLPLPIGP